MKRLLWLDDVRNPIDPEYDRFGIYEISSTDRDLEMPELVNKYSKYSPYLLIWEANKKWFFMYTEKTHGSSGTFSDPYGTPDDYDYVEHPDYGVYCDEIFINVVEFLAALHAKEYLFTD